MEKENQPHSSGPMKPPYNQSILKGIIIISIIALLMIPTYMIINLVHEREARKNDVLREISRKWAGEQTIQGPVIMVPYTSTVKDGSGKPQTEIRQLYFLPEKADIQANMLPEKRHRSIYEVMLYTSRLSLSGNFRPLKDYQIPVPGEQIQWDQAKMLISITDSRGITGNLICDWNGHPLPLQNSPELSGNFPGPHTAAIAMSPDQPIQFHIALNIKGTETLKLLPIGNETDVTVTSPWEAPSIVGEYIPDALQQDPHQGFKAHWQIPGTARNFGQVWNNAIPDLGTTAFGVKLFLPADSYAKTDRATKYAILFISLTFAVFFLTELIRKKAIHPLQYVLVGFALVIFYTLLLSVSEYTGFNMGYLIASVATTGLIGLYARGIFTSSRAALGFTAGLCTLYGYIFFLVQLQDYALLSGSIGLFLILAMVMYFSRKIDWNGTPSAH